MASSTHNPRFNITNPCIQTTQVPVIFRPPLLKRVWSLANAYDEINLLNSHHKKATGKTGLMVIGFKDLSKVAKHLSMFGLEVRLVESVPL